MQGFKQFYNAPIPAEASFRIRGMGLHERMRPCQVSRPTGKPDYLFMCFHDPVQVEESGLLRAVDPPGLMIWAPGQRQVYGSSLRSWDHSWFHCEGPSVARILAASRIPLNRILPFPDPLILEKALISLYDELTLHRHPDPKILQNTFEIFVRGLARQQKKPDAPESVPTRFLQTRTWMDAHYDRHITLAGLAQQTHLSVPHFCSEFKRYFGMSAIEYLIRVRMQAAVHHLGDCNRSITEVARLAGYENLFHFSRLFRQRLGLSPTAMRARALGRDVRKS